MSPGDIIRFHDSSAVVLLERDGHAWRVMYVHGSREWPQGTVTWVSREALSAGDVLDFDEIDRDADHLHELFHAVGRIEEEIMARTDGR